MSDTKKQPLAKIAVKKHPHCPYCIEPLNYKKFSNIKESIMRWKCPKCNRTFQ